MDTGSELITLLRYDDRRHEYVDPRSGEVVPGITGMLKAFGWIDTTWLTLEGRERGTAVHRLTLDYDLDAIALDNVQGRYRGYLLGWAKAMGIMRPTWTHLEEPFIHPVLRFGGTPDRVGTVWSQRAVVEQKTGDYEKYHPIQTALQAILVASELNVPPETIARFAVYLKPDGKFKVEQFIDLSDLRQARGVLRKCIHGAL